MATISAKIDNSYKQSITEIANKSGKSVSELIKICLDEIMAGNLYLDGDHVLPSGACLEVNEEEHYERLGYDKVLRALRAKGYPDEAIRKFNDTWLSQLYEMPKYNARRARDWDSC